MRRYGRDRHYEEDYDYMPSRRRRGYYRDDIEEDQRRRSLFSGEDKRYWRQAKSNMTLDDIQKGVMTTTDWELGEDNPESPVLKIGNIKGYNLKEVTEYSLAVSNMAEILDLRRNKDFLATLFDEYENIDSYSIVCFVQLLCLLLPLKFLMDWKLDSTEFDNTYSIVNHIRKNSKFIKRYLRASKLDIQMGKLFWNGSDLNRMLEIITSKKNLI